MCLTVAKPVPKDWDMIKPEINLKDRIVYKVLEVQKGKGKNRYFSPHQGMEYERGMHYSENFSVSLNFSSVDISAFINIYQGLHCYTEQEIALKNAERRNLCYNGKYKVFEMVIPKGALYYESTGIGEICSNELIFY